jgi:hypothetical protein
VTYREGLRFSGFHCHTMGWSWGAHMNWGNRQNHGYALSPWGREICRGSCTRGEPLSIPEWPASWTDGPG